MHSTEPLAQVDVPDIESQLTFDFTRRLHYNNYYPALSRTMHNLSERASKRA